VLETRTHKQVNLRNKLINLRKPFLITDGIPETWPAYTRSMYLASNEARITKYEYHNTIRTG